MAITLARITTASGPAVAKPTTKAGSSHAVSLGVSSLKRLVTSHRPKSPVQATGSDWLRAIARADPLWIIGCELLGEVEVTPKAKPKAEAVINPASASCAVGQACSRMVVMTGRPLKSDSP